MLRNLISRWDPNEKTHRNFCVHLLLLLLLEFWVFVYFLLPLVTDTALVVSPGLDGMRARMWNKGLCKSYSSNSPYDLTLHHLL